MRSTLLILIVAIVCNVSSSGQDPIETISFSYDAAGNRTGRSIELYSGGGGLKSVALTKEEVEEEIEDIKQINVYPNPVKDIIYLTLDDESLEATEKNLQVFDSMGRLIKDIEVHSYLNEIDVSGLKSGSYILRLLYADNSQQWTIIKQ